MQAYRRFVSYVYQYENGKKAGNRGFIKVEARGNTCSMQISLKGICRDENGSCSVYGFKREDGLLKGSLLAECPVNTGILQEQIVFPRNELGRAKYGLHELSGVIFQGGDQTIYGTQWDDDPMKIENFQPDEKNVGIEKEIQEPLEKEIEDRQNWNDPREGEWTVSDKRAEDQEPDEILQPMQPEVPESDWPEGAPGGISPEEIVEKESAVKAEQGEEAEKESEMEAEQEEEAEKGPEMEAEQEEEAQKGPEMEAEQEEEAQKGPEMEAEQEEQAEKDPEMEAEQEEEAQKGPEMEAEQEEEAQKGPEMEAEQEEEAQKGSEMEAEQEEQAEKDPEMEAAQEDLAGNTFAVETEPEELEENGPVMEVEPEEQEEELTEILDTTVPLEDLPRQPEPEPEQDGPERRVSEIQTEERKSSEKNFCPFSDGVLEDFRKIKIGDLKFLDSRDQSLRNNRFVQHGYQMFGHLLLARIARNGQYILGVPGMYQQQEKFMADMFGFHNFKYAKRSGSKQPSNFGYWYRLIYPPKLCRGNGRAK